MKPDLKDLVETLLSIRDEKVLRKFLTGILTDMELEDIPRRLRIVKMLKQGVAQREIAEKLGVGIATVTRGSKEVKRGNFDMI
jgi:TrpR family transcriptional regulator, trp operon repressor